MNYFLVFYFRESVIVSSLFKTGGLNVFKIILNESDDRLENFGFGLNLYRLS